MDLGAPLNRLCKQPVRSAALRRSGKLSKAFSREPLVGGRIAQARSPGGEPTSFPQLRRIGVLNRKSHSFRRACWRVGQVASKTNYNTNLSLRYHRVRVGEKSVNSHGWSAKRMCQMDEEILCNCPNM
jgi:hypothetical protein